MCFPIFRLIKRESNERKMVDKEHFQISRDKHETETAPCHRIMTHIAIPCSPIELSPHIPKKPLTIKSDILAKTSRNSLVWKIPIQIWCKNESAFPFFVILFCSPIFTTSSGRVSWTEMFYFLTSKRSQSSFCRKPDKPLLLPFIQ